MRSRIIPTFMNLAGVAALLACAPLPDDGEDNGPYPAPDGAGGSSIGENPTPELPPEQEVESHYEAPVATGKYVWISNPISGRVAYVDATSLEVRTVAAGYSPRTLAAIPDPQGDTAIVINELSSDASILRATPTGDVSVSSVDIVHDANAWTVSDDGKWAIAWTNPVLFPDASPVQGFQEVSVVDLSKDSSTRISVGYRPIMAVFSSHGEQAYIVTQDGISVIDLLPQGPRATRLVPITQDPFEDPGTRDVSITPDGAYALVRRDGISEVTVVSLSDGTLTQVSLSGPCTDLDLTKDGTRALAVVRDEGEVAILPIPEIASNPADFEVVRVEKATVGSVVLADEAPVALAYSNAVSEMRITKLLFDESPAAATTLKLYAPVLATFLAPSGANAVIVHRHVSGAPGAFSFLSLTPELPAKIVATKGIVSTVAMAPSGNRAIVTERTDSEKVFGAYLIRSENQQVDHYPLASPPIAAGIVTGANRAYVAQQHPEGRLTFIDLDTGFVRTLTGFELATKVVDGSEP